MAQGGVMRIKYTLACSSCYWVVDEIHYVTDKYVKLSVRTFLKDTNSYIPELSGKHKIIKSVYDCWEEIE